MPANAAKTARAFIFIFSDKIAVKPLGNFWLSIVTEGVGVRDLTHILLAPTSTWTAVRRPPYIFQSLNRQNGSRFPSIFEKTRHFLPISTLDYLPAVRWRQCVIPSLLCQKNWGGG